MKSKKYILDPDFRKNPPKNKPYCVRCQKALNNVNNAIKVTVDWDNWTVTEGGSELMGLDCWKQTIKVNK